MRTLVIRFLFYPTLLWNLLLSRVLGLREWWDRVDEHVVLGALPFARDVPRLRAAGITGVVNTCAEYTGPVAAYTRAGITQLHIPILDYSPPTEADVARALAFIREVAAKGGDVYVHCKAGRGRSATVVMCYLIAEKGMSPDEAQRHLLTVRPHVNQGLLNRAIVQATWRKRS